MVNYAERSFGVEIECGTPTLPEHMQPRSSYYSKQTMGAQGTRTLFQKAGLSHWANRIGYDGTEIEIRSPILKGTAGLNELKKVMNLLKSNGYYTTADDGMHCHFDASDLNESDILRIMESWDANKEIVRTFLGDRFNNGYCSYDYDFDRLKSEDYYRQTVWSYDGEKCFAIEPRQRLGTLEFRQHYGTLEFEEARAWILLVQAFIRTIARRKMVIKRVSMDELFAMTNTYKIAQHNLKMRQKNPYVESW